ncbi:MAG: class I SAM-dependent methyltransferase, partial [Nitrospinota bacterium]
RFYPYIARQILETYGRKSGRALELGPYAPGISAALARLAPELEITVADDTPGIHPHFADFLAKAGLRDRIRLEEADVEALPYDDGSYDLVYFRGALFFTWDPVKLLRESDRVLRPGGTALIGGGFGAETPNAEIDEIAPQARDLNRKLGKRVVRYEEAEAFAREAGVWERSRLDKRHGLWVVIRKEGKDEGER